MKPFHEVINKIKWSKDEKIDDYIIGYFDRVEDKILEMPLSPFLSSEIPEHRARYIKKHGGIVWDRRK
jgi:uncharacterized protein (UPF0248 family)